MGRKKKNEKNSEEEVSEGEGGKLFDFDLASDAKRSAVSVFLFALSLVTVLGFFGQAGVVGNFLSSAAGLSVGWAKFVFPIFLSAGGVILLFRKETSFYVLKIIGLFVTLSAMVGFLHWFVDPLKMLEIARLGQGGGYLGYVVSYSFFKLLGPAGSLVGIFALFLIGIIVAFNFSLIGFSQYLKKKWLELKEAGRPVADGADSREGEVAEEGESKEKNEGEDFELPADPKEEDELKEEDSETVANIKNFEFVDGNDRKIDQEFFEKEKETKKKSKKNLKKEEVEEEWELPPISLLEEGSSKGRAGDTRSVAEKITKTARDFGIIMEHVTTQVGPTVTQYGFRPDVGVKISKIVALQNELALALAKQSIRIEAPIPGKSLVGIEVPNDSPAVVKMGDLLGGQKFKIEKSGLTLILGEDVNGEPVMSDLGKMPHLMIAGSTGAGKSAVINSIVTALLYQNTPEDLKLILVDPKRVELTLFSGIPHLRTEVIVDSAKAINALKWAVSEMNRRYKLLQRWKFRDISSYREKFDPEESITYNDPESQQEVEEFMENMPYIVIIIDELADLMAERGKEAEAVIARIAQMARAVGIHLIVSTQRPSVEVITGLIKSNIGTRIALRVPSQVDSRTIIDMPGAEKLLGRGDMLFMVAGSSKPRRIQGVFVSEKEVKAVADFWVNQKNRMDFFQDDEMGGGYSEKMDEAGFFSGETEENIDPLYETAKKTVLETRKASASYLQRRLQVGYARAARLLDLMEERGVVGPSKGAKPRDIFVASSGTEINYEDDSEDQEIRENWGK